MDVKAYWRAVLSKDAEAMRACFHPDARIDWHNTGERFSVEEFIRANCEYPGEWDGEVENILSDGARVAVAVRVYGREGGPSFHACSFLHIVDEKIASIDEYWGDDGEPPQWRQDARIGTRIRKDT